MKKAHNVSVAVHTPGDRQRQVEPGSASDISRIGEIHRFDKRLTSELCRRRRSASDVGGLE